MEKRFRKNSKEVKYVYNYIIDEIKFIQEYWIGEGNTYIFKLKYQYHYLCGDNNFEFMLREDLYVDHLGQFWDKLFEYDDENYKIIESVKWRFFNNECYYEITLTNLIQDLNFKK